MFRFQLLLRCLHADNPPRFIFIKTTAILFSTLDWSSGVEKSNPAAILAGHLNSSPPDRFPPSFFS